MHQTTFSPYRQVDIHAQHFTNDRIVMQITLQCITQDFCMEAWIKLRTQGVNLKDTLLIKQAGLKDG